MIKLKNLYNDINLYCGSYLFLFNKNISNIFLSSLVPVLGVILSTLSLKFIRKIWENSIK